MENQNPMPKVFMPTRELAERWLVTPEILRYWRRRQTGPSYYKIVTKVLYKIEEIEEFEKSPAYKMVVDYRLKQDNLKRD